MEIQLIYPVSRLLNNPRVFYAIANYLEGPDVDTLKDAFYELLEYEFNNYDDPTECEFEAEEVCFKSEEEGKTISVILDSGIATVLQAVEGETYSRISNSNEMAAATAIYQRLVKAIEETDPAFEGDIALCSPPTPANSYLRSTDGDRFEGSFHLLSNPEKLYAFNIEVIDVDTDQLRAHIKPM